MNSKILILGKGFIGKRLQRDLGCSISEERIRSFEDARKEIKKYRPKIIINCIGHTGKYNVDDCELVKDKVLMSNTLWSIKAG